MYNIIIKNIENKYDFAELIKIFLRPEEFNAYTEAEYVEKAEACEPVELIIFNEERSEDKNEIKREIYNKLSRLTDKKPEWGILTGVRPVKLTGELFQRLKTQEAVESELSHTYLLAEEKIRLLTDTYNY